MGPLPQESTAAPRTFGSIESFAGAVGESLGHTTWVELDAERVVAFCEATGATASSGAHVPAFMVLSSVSPLVKSLYDVRGVTTRINYGVDAMQSLAPVPVGSRVRAHVRISAGERTTSGHRVRLRLTLERAGEEGPVGSADVLLVLLAEDQPSKAPRLK